MKSRALIIVTIALFITSCEEEDGFDPNIEQRINFILYLNLNRLL